MASAFQTFQTAAFSSSLTRLYFCACCPPVTFLLIWVIGLGIRNLPQLWFHLTTDIPWKLLENTASEEKSCYPEEDKIWHNFLRPQTIYLSRCCRCPTPRNSAQLTTLFIQEQKWNDCWNNCLFEASTRDKRRVGVDEKEKLEEGRDEEGSCEERRWKRDGGEGTLTLLLNDLASPETSWNFPLFFVDIFDKWKKKRRKWTRQKVQREVTSSGFYFSWLCCKKNIWSRSVKGSFLASTSFMNN